MLALFLENENLEENERVRKKMGEETLILELSARFQMLNLISMEEVRVRLCPPLLFSFFLF